MTDTPPQDEVGYVLSVIKDNWPADEFPNHLARIDRDEPKILETDERTKSIELSRWNAVGASLVDRSTNPRGTEYDHYIETVVDVRVEGLHETEHGNVSSTMAFRHLVNAIRRAILTERSYPPLDGSLSVDEGETYTIDGTETYSSVDVQGSLENPDGSLQVTGELPPIVYRDLRVENQTELSGDEKNHYRVDFDVRLTGVEVLPEL